MTRVLIRNRLERDFAMVPNGVWRSDLPFAAKGVACYLFSLRDGAMPYVAEMEQALGLGRDARRKAFASLEAFGVIRWVTERNAKGGIVAKTLEIDPTPFFHTPESQAHGQVASENAHAPENPAGGKSTPVATETRRSIDGKSGDTLRQEKQDRARQARSCASSRSRSPRKSASGDASLGANLGQPLTLSGFVMAQLRKGEAVLMPDGFWLRPESPEAQRALAAERSLESASL